MATGACRVLGNSERCGSRADACAPCGFGFAESSLRTLRVLRCISAPLNLRGFAFSNSLRTDLKVVFYLPSAEEVWRMLPPDITTQGSGSPVALRGEACPASGAVARAKTIGVSNRTSGVPMLNEKLRAVWLSLPLRRILVASHFTIRPAPT